MKSVEEMKSNIAEMNKGYGDMFNKLQNLTNEQSNQIKNIMVELSKP